MGAATAAINYSFRRFNIIIREEIIIISYQQTFLLVLHNILCFLYCIIVSNITVYTTVQVYPSTVTRHTLNAI